MVAQQKINDESKYTRPGKWWSRQSDNKFRCELCPRACELTPGKRGFCFVRKGSEEGIVLTTYGKSSGFCIDPIEKKPLNHFYPGSAVLSFGTVGCNLGCQFCQNWYISKARKQARLLDEAFPETIAQAASDKGITSVAFTYNDPVIFAEYAIDTAKACHERGVKTVAVTAGYISEQAREEFFSVLDAVNIDLKAFSENFYVKNSLAHLQPVLETIDYVANHTDTWLELTTLLIPGENDSEDEVKEMSKWIVDHIGPNIPLHFSAFHPDFRMKDKPHTSHTSLKRAREIAKDVGINYVYLGNVNDFQGSSTYCPHCNKLIVGREWYKLSSYHIKDGCCSHCGEKIAGRFNESLGQWGPKRQPVSFTTERKQHL